MIPRDLVETVVPAAKGARWAAYLVAGLLIAAVVGFAVWWLLIRPQRAQQRAAGAKVEAVTAKASAGAAQDAVKVITQHDRTIERTNTITQGGVRVVQSAADAGTPVPGVAAAVRSSVCLYATYSGDPDCAALRRAGAGIGPAEADAGR